MKNHWKIFYKTLLLLLIITSNLPVSAQNNPGQPSPRINDLDDMTFIEMINSVDCGKNAELIRKFQAKEGKDRLLNGKFSPKGECTVENFRNKEVLLVTIPAHLLFAPNEIELSKNAAEYLTPFKRYLKDPDMYRVLLVMHTDNTGSDLYRDEITEDRVEAIFDWFERQGVDTSYLFSYAMSDEIPLVPNNSMVNRAKNRRLEVYLMPGKKMIEQAKKGRIAF
ncbi:MAG: OmpA family protein [Muribaculaceae bacterium]|nr:OmpA family protein [Muribaculaceae bacterium]